MREPNHQLVLCQGVCVAIPRGGAFLIILLPCELRVSVSWRRMGSAALHGQGEVWWRDGCEDTGTVILTVIVPSMVIACNTQPHALFKSSYLQILMRTTTQLSTSSLSGSANVTAGALNPRTDLSLSTLGFANCQN